MIIGEFTRDWLREVKLDGDNHVFKISNFLDCGTFPQPAGAFECDTPMDLQFGDDGAFYLLTYGDGFFNVNPDAGMYKWEYAKGQRAPRAVLDTDRTDGPVPLTVNFSGARSVDPDPGDSIRFEWDFGDGSPLSTEVSPTHTYTQRGRYTAVLTVTDSAGRETRVSTVITVGNTSPTVTIHVPVEGGTFAFGDSIPYAVTVTDPEDGPVNCADVQVTFVLGHDEHGHAEESTTGCTGSLQTLADDVSHGGNVFGVINVRYQDTGGPGDVPALTTIEEVKIRQRKQQVEHVVNQSGTNTGTNTDEGSGTHRGSLAPDDWIQLNGPFNLANIDSLTFRVADTAAGRTAGLAAGGGRTAHGLRDRADRVDVQPDVDRRHGRLDQPDVPDLAGRPERAVPRVPRGRRRSDGQQPVQPQLRRVQRQGRLGHPDVDAGHDRRHRAADAVALARRAGHLRGLHPGRQPDL